MIRFFGIILGIVLMAGIAFTVYDDGYRFSSLTTMGKEIVQVVGDAIRCLSGKTILALQDADTNAGGAMPTTTQQDIATDNQDEKVLTAVAEEPAAADLAAATIAQDVPIIQEEIIEQPSEVRIFWGPFRNRGAAQGFAAMAGKIGGMPTEVIEKSRHRIYVAFVGQPAAIDTAIAVFADQTGMDIRQDYAL